MKFNKILLTIMLFSLIACESGDSEGIIYEDKLKLSKDVIATVPAFTENVDEIKLRNNISEITPEPKDTITTIVVTEESKDNEKVIEALSKVKNIVDPNNISWPRTIVINDKEIIIDEKPDRVLTISLGHDEILFGISNDNQIVGTTTFAQEEGSNIKDKAHGLPTITSDPESIIILSPDIVFADPYAPIELIDTLMDLDIMVIQTSLNNDISGRKNDIWFMGYITGNLEKAQKLVSNIDRKIENLSRITKNNNVKKKVLTLSWWDSYWTAGIGSTEDSIIKLTGAINVASENGIESNTTIDKEKLIYMNPEIILITQSVSWGGEDFYNQLISDSSLSSIDAIKNNNVFLVNPNLWGTLSYWNIMGSKELIEILLPESKLDDFGGF